MTVEELIAHRMLTEHTLDTVTVKLPSHFRLVPVN